MYLFYRDLIGACICFTYRYLYLFYRNIIVICVCFIESLSLFVYALSRAYRLYLLFTCDVGEIDNGFRVNTIPLPVIILCAWDPTSMKFRIQFIGDTIIILWIRYYLWYIHFLWMSWFFANREIRNSTNMCHNIYLPIKLTSMNWNEFTVSLIIKSGVVLCSIWRDAVFTISMPQGVGVADRLKYLLWTNLFWVLSFKCLFHWYCALYSPLWFLNS